jgi:MFS family permease
MRRIFLVLSVTMLCAGLCFQITSFALPKLFEERLSGDLNDNILGIGGMVTLVYGLAGMAQFLGGELSDRLSTRAVYLTSIALQVPVMVAAYWLMGPGLVGAAALIASLNAAGQPAENSLLARYSPPSWQGRAFGAKFVLTLGVSAAGVALIPVVHRLTGTLDLLLLIMAAIAATASIAGFFLPVTSKPTMDQEIAAAE